MRCHLLCFALVALSIAIADPLCGAAATPAHRQKAATTSGNDGQRNLGIGISLFSPTGFSVKYLLQDEAAVDGAIGWSDNDIDVQGDYLLLQYHLLIEKGWSLNLHYGLGGRVVIARNSDRGGYGQEEKHDNRVGVRLPLGLDVTTGKANIELFGEIALILDFIKKTEAQLNVALGARYYL